MANFLNSLCRFGALAVPAAVLSATGVAHAQTAGTWMGKVGINNIAPDVKSGDLSATSLPHTTIDIKDATSLIATATYMLTDAVAIEFYGGLGYKHDVVGAGAIAGVGKIGTVKQVSPTVFAQYRFFAPNSTWRPFVGLGLTYAYFYGEEGSGALTAMTNGGSGVPTKMSASAAWGVSPQLGLALRLDDHWFVDAAVVKTYIKNSTTLSTGQSISTRLDPLSIGVAVGYRF